ncbi:hypothetical protein HK405_013588, partial [Cladochytrium tenue]
ILRARDVVILDLTGKVLLFMVDRATTRFPGVMGFASQDGHTATQWGDFNEALALDSQSVLAFKTSHKPRIPDISNQEEFLAEVRQVDSSSMSICMPPAHFAYWPAQGHRPDGACPSARLRDESPAALGIARNYLNSVQPAVKLMNAVYEVCDPEGFRETAQLRDKILNGVPHFMPAAVHLGIALNGNTVSGLHVDKDATMCCIFVHGKFTEGGEFGLYDLGLAFSFLPGSSVAFFSRYMRHTINPFKGGYRFSHVLFSKEALAMDGARLSWASPETMARYAKIFGVLEKEELSDVDKN